MFPDRHGSDVDHAQALGNGQHRPAPRELTQAETREALDATMARVKAKYPHLFTTQDEDAEGLAERRWSQR